MRDLAHIELIFTNHDEFLHYLTGLVHEGLSSRLPRIAFMCDLRRKNGAPAYVPKLMAEFTVLVHPDAGLMQTVRLRAPVDEREMAIGALKDLGFKVCRGEAILIGG